MELREYYKIWKSNISIVIYTVIIFVVAAYIWSNRQGELYLASLNLNVSRTQTQNSSDYRYDQFYRIQADEKIAETIGQWLKSPGVASEILEKAGAKNDSVSTRQLSKTFRAEKISPETVSVKFSAANEDEAKKISNAIGSIIEEKLKNLNEQAHDPLWFAVTPADFIVLRNVQDLRINLSVALIAGLFLGTFFAFGRHYISEPES